VSPRAGLDIIYIIKLRLEIWILLSSGERKWGEEGQKAYLVGPLFELVQLASDLVQAQQAQPSQPSGRTDRFSVFLCSFFYPMTKAESSFRKAIL
jgi:hypothetical protein